MRADKSMLTPRLQVHAARCYGVLVGVLLLVSAVAALAAEVPAPQATTHLVGTVLDAGGGPAKGALVGIMGNDRALMEKERTGRPLEAKVAANGRFDLPVPSDLGTVTVVARLPGSLSATSQPIALRGARREVAQLRLGVGLKLTGRVVDEQRKPIAGAVVQATLGTSADTLSLGSVTARGKTNREGSFEIAGLDRGRFKITAFSNSHAMWTKEWHRIDLTPASRRLDITLGRGEFLSGTVLDAAGLPIAGAVIADSRSDSTISTTSDARGRFRLGPFTSSATRDIHASLAGYTPHSAWFAPPRSDLVLVLYRNATLRGRVVDAATQRPIPGFQVTIYDPNKITREDWVGPRTFNAADGGFELTNVHAGSWTVSVLARGYVPWESAGFAFEAGSTQQLTVALTKGTSLRGRVIDKATGKALPGARVSFGREVNYYFSSFEAPAKPPRAISDAAGLFVLEGVPPSGAVTLSAAIDGYRTVNERVNVEAQSFVELAASRGAVVRGQVVAADGVTPLQSRVRLEQGRGSTTIGTDEQGRFNFAKQEPGRYRLEAEADTGRSESRELTLEEGQVAEVLLRVSPAASVRGRLSGVSPAALDTIKVSVDAAGFSAANFSTVRGGSFDTAGIIESNGTYRVQSLAGGPTLVGVSSPTRTIVKKLEVPERSEVTLDFDFADERVTGRVTRNGRPLSGAYVHASPLDGQAVMAAATTGANGEYALCELVPGRYSMGVSLTLGLDKPSLYVSDLGEVIVEVKERLVQNFELAPFDIRGRVVDASTGRGLAAVNARLLPLGTQSRDSNYRTYAIPSNAQGEFVISQIDAGEYQLVLYRGGYDLAEQRISVRDSIEDLVITMQPTEGVRLRVRGPDGKGLAGLTVYVQSVETPAFELYMPLDDDGVGWLPPALAGRSLRFAGGDHGSVVIPRWNGAPLDIQLRARAR